MNKGLSWFFLFALLTLLPVAAAPLKVADLEVRPSGDASPPTLSWVAQSDERGKSQSGYEILAASSLDKLTPDEADLWSSKFVEGSERHGVKWEGKKLDEGQKVFWKVRLRDEKEKFGDWSEPSHFVAGEALKKQPLKRLATFESSSKVLNELFEETATLLRGRLEKFAQGDKKALGKGAAVQIAARESLYHFDAEPHLREWLALVTEARTKEGFFPVGPGHETYGSVHSDVGVALNFPLWWMTGDKPAVKAAWPICEKYMQARETVDRAFRGETWGLPYPSEEQTSAQINASFLAYTNRLLRELAAPAEEPMNVIRYQDYAARMKKQFQNLFVDESGKLQNNSQTAKALALRSAVLSPELQKQILAELFEEVRKDGPKVTPLGAHFLMSVFFLTNNIDPAISTLTSLSPEARETFLTSGMTSWFLGGLAGIDSAALGFKQVRIAPKLASAEVLSSVKATYLANSGRIASSWKRDGKAVHYTITIPVGTTAQILLPMTGETITEGGKKLEEIESVMLISKTGGQYHLAARSGTYQFVVQ